MNMFFPEIETKSKSEIIRYQEQKLQEQIQYLYSNSPYYSQLFDRWQIKPQAIKKLEDLSKIPFTTKDDIANNNQDFYCVPKKNIIDYISTSGTLGDPVIFAMTDNDLERLAYNEAISLSCSGCSEKDIIQLTTTLDKRFMAGLAYFLGARKLQAGVIRVGSGIPELQWDTIKRIQPTVIIAVPSFILYLIKYAQQNNIDYKNSSIKKAICIGEPLKKSDLSYSTLAEKIKANWDIDLYSTYASTEMATAFAECSERIGGHHHPELIIAEFIDENGNQVPAGEPGELVITNLGIEGMPLLRFKTGDICIHYDDPCACGRNTTRIGPVLGRKQQMIKFKGTTIYPPSLFDILDAITEIENYIIEVATNDIGTDDLTIIVGCKNQSPEIEKKIKDHFRARINVAPKVLFESIKNIEKIQSPESTRKPIRFLDKRVS